MSGGSIICMLSQVPCEMLKVVGCGENRFDTPRDSMLYLAAMWLQRIGRDTAMLPKAA
jgi:hypothetical protein